MTSLLVKASGKGKVENLPYDDQSPNNRVDLWLPTSTPLAAGRPLIIWVPGGAALTSNEDASVIPVDKGLVEAGFAVASVRYRTSSEATWDTQLKDVKSAIRYLRAHAGIWKLYPDKFGIWGASFGGQLAALCGCTNGVAKFDVGSYLHTSSNVTVVMDDYGPTDLVKLCMTVGFTQYQAVDSWVTKLLGAPALSVPNLADDASPMFWASPASAPLAALHGKADAQVAWQQSADLVTRLTNFGVPAVAKLVDGKTHADPTLYPTDWIAAVSAMFRDWLQP